MILSSHGVVRFWAAAAVFFSLWSPRVAAAKPADDARRLVADAIVAYNLGHFDEAALKYEECYRLIAEPVLLFDLAQAYRLDGRPELALRAYRSFLRTAPADAPERAIAERQAAALAQVVKTTTAESWRPSGEPATSMSAPAQVVKTTTAATWRPSEQPATSMSAPGTDLIRSTDRASAEPRFYRRWWFWTAAGAAVVGGVALGYVLHDRREGALAGSVEPGVVPVR